MDPANIVEDTERTRFCSQKDGQMDDVKPVYPSYNFIKVGGIKISMDTFTNGILTNYYIIKCDQMCHNHNSDITENMNQLEYKGHHLIYSGH